MRTMPLHNYCYKSSMNVLSQLAALSVAITVLMVGCGERGSPVEPVSGRVTLDGQPLPGARIMFQPDATGGSPSYGTADSEGRYQLGYKRGVQGAQVGMHTVIIQGGADAEAATPRKLPARYNTETELRKEVKSGEDNTIDFELKSEPK
jgi:hypothetical protein